MGGPAGALLELVDAIPREHGVRVRVHKSGHHEAVAGIDNGALFFDQGFDFGPRTYSLDAALFDEHGAIVNDGEAAHFNTGARAMRSSERDELGTTQDGELHAVLQGNLIFVWGRLLICGRLAIGLSL